MNNVSAFLKFVGAMSAVGPTNLLQAAVGLDFSQSLQFTAGTGALQCDQIYTQQGTLTYGQSTTLTLSALTDCFGAALVMARLKGYAFINNSSVSNTSFAVGGAGNTVNLFTPQTASESIPMGGFVSKGFADATGIPITVASSDKLVITNNGSAGSTTVYNLYLLGASA